MRSVAAFLFALFFALPAFAEARPSEAEVAARMPAAREVTTAARIDEVLRSGINISMPVMLSTLRSQAPQLTDADLQRFVALFNEEIDREMPAIVEEIAREYALRFTQSELRDILGFYRTPTGRHSLQEIVSLQQAAAAIGQRHGAAAGLRAADRLQREKTAP